jgi:hypothetical protein
LIADGTDIEGDEGGGWLKEPFAFESYLPMQVKGTFIYSSSSHSLAIS